MVQRWRAPTGSRTLLEHYRRVATSPFGSSASPFVLPNGRDQRPGNSGRRPAVERSAASCCWALRPEFGPEAASRFAARLTSPWHHSEGVRSDRIGPRFCDLRVLVGGYARDADRTDNLA